jgi:hypothetical protein
VNHTIAHRGDQGVRRAFAARLKCANQTAHAKISISARRAAASYAYRNNRDSLVNADAPVVCLRCIKLGGNGVRLLQVPL